MASKEADAPSATVSRKRNRSGDSELPLPPVRESVSCSAWDVEMGHRLAVRVGNVIAVGGTAGREMDGSFSADVTVQTTRCLEIISKALKELGASNHHVIRTRIFTTSIALWEGIAAVHGKAFEGIHPTTTMVQLPLWCK
jgi:enamine deaminase RidA (YjgF/YER057c/UK114 family)